MEHNWHGSLEPVARVQTRIIRGIRNESKLHGDVLSGAHDQTAAEETRINRERARPDQEESCSHGEGEDKLIRIPINLIPSDGDKSNARRNAANGRKRSKAKEKAEYGRSNTLPRAEPRRFRHRAVHQHSGSTQTQDEKPITRRANRKHGK